MGVKELQSLYMDDVIKQGDLSSEKADWLIKQHKNQQSAIHAMYDDEISRQRMNLEEKLARRKALAQASVSSTIKLILVHLFLTVKTNTICK